jgi:hypothetical protein
LQSLLLERKGQYKQAMEQLKEARKFSFAELHLKFWKTREIDSE